MKIVNKMNYNTFNNKNVHKVSKFPGIRAESCNNPELLPGTHDINNKDVQVTNATEL